MKYITHRFTLDVNKTSAQLSLACKQNDTAIQLRIKLTDNGKPYQITDDCTALFTATKPDGTVLYNYCMIENNTIVYTFTDQTVSCKGRMNVEIRLSGEEGVITSPSFILIVDEPVLNEYDVLSSSEATALVGLVGQTNIAISEANAAAAAASAAVNGVEETAQWLSEQVGRAVEMRYDPETGYLQYRLIGDTAWVDIASVDDDLLARKADKVEGAKAGNLAALDADGNLLDGEESVNSIVAKAVAAGLKVELGTYAGTLSGSSAGGAGSPTTVNFDGKPLFVLIRSTKTATTTPTSVPAVGAWMFAWRVEDSSRTKWDNYIVYNSETAGFYLLYKPSDGEGGVDFGENSISFYSTKTPYTSIYQLNSNYCSYSYIAILE